MAAVAWDQAMAGAIKTRLETMGAEVQALGQRHDDLGASRAALIASRPASVEIGGELYPVTASAFVGSQRPYHVALARQAATETAWLEASHELGQRYAGVVAWASAQVESAHPGLSERGEEARAWLATHPPPPSAVGREWTQARWSHLVMVQAAEQACVRQGELASTWQALAAAREAQAESAQGQTWSLAKVGRRADPEETSRWGGEVFALEQRAAEGVQAQQWSAASQALAEAAVAEAEPELAASIREYEAQQKEAERLEQVRLICERFEAARQSRSQPERDWRLEQDMDLLQAHCDTRPDDFSCALTLAHTFVQVGYLEAGLATFDRVKDEGPPDLASHAQHAYDQIVHADATIQEAHQDLTRQFQEQLQAEAQDLAQANLEARKAIQAESNAHRASQPPRTAPTPVLNEWDEKNADLSATHRELYDEGRRIQDLTNFKNPTSLGSQELHKRLEQQAPHLHQAHRRIERDAFARQLDRQIQQRALGRGHGHEL